MAPVGGEGGHWQWGWGRGLEPGLCRLLDVALEGLQLAAAQLKLGLQLLQLLDGVGTMEGELGSYLGCC